MNGEMHARAERLIAQERVEGISHEERAWLDAHLRECQRCSQVAQATESALKSLRALAVPLPRGLAARTQFRVQMRAEELRARAPRRRALWVACAVSWGLGVGSAPYVWRAFEWLGNYTGMPKLLWQIGFGLWWTIPTLLAAVILLMENAARAGQQDWMRETK